MKTIKEQLDKRKARKKWLDKGNNREKDRERSRMRYEKTKAQKASLEKLLGRSITIREFYKLTAGEDGSSSAPD